MSFISITDYDSSSTEVKSRYDYQIEKHGRITNMKRTLLHNTVAFDTYMMWYDLKDRIVPFIGERAFSLFSYAISSENDCLICSLFFRKILVDSGDNPDEPKLNKTEKLLMEFGKHISKNPHNIPEEIYAELKSLFNDEELTLLISFAGQMVATNLFNTVAKVPLDEILYAYKK